MRATRQNTWFKIGQDSYEKNLNMSGFLFLLVIHFIMRRALHEGDTGIRSKFTTKLEDLDFGGDTVFLLDHIQTKSSKVAEQAVRVGLKGNVEKCKQHASRLLLYHQHSGC